MAPTSTLTLLSAVHSTTVLSGPFVTPSTISPAGTTVLTYDLWKGGLVCFAVAIVSVVGYFYRRRRKDAMSEPKQPSIALPIILPSNDSAFCSPYDTSLSCGRPVLQFGRNQLVKHVAPPCNVEVVCGCSTVATAPSEVDIVWLQIPMVHTGTAVSQITEDQLCVGQYGEIDVTEANYDCGGQVRDIV